MESSRRTEARRSSLVFTGHLKDNVEVEECVCV